MKCLCILMLCFSVSSIMDCNLEARITNVNFSKKVKREKRNISKIKHKAIFVKTKKDENGLNAQYAILIDCDTGETLFQKFSDIKNPPSSMTKIMTLYLLFDALVNNKITLKDELNVSDFAQSMPGSRSFFKSGEKVKIEDLIRSIVVHSGNDACVIIAEGLFGSVDAFVVEMNKTIIKFGLKNTSFVNPSGLPNENHYSTVADLAFIARRLIKDFPQFYHYFSEKEFTINGIRQMSRNSLLGKIYNIDGLKTGRTTDGGYGIIVSGTKGDKRLILAINGCHTAKERETDARQLMTYGFNAFSKIKIAEAGRPITFANVWLGDKAKIDLHANKDIEIFISKKMLKSLEIVAKIYEPIEAPIKVGDKVGELFYKYEGYTSKFYNLYASESTEKLSWIHRMISAIQYFLLGSGIQKIQDKDGFIYKKIRIHNAQAYIN